MLVVGHLAGPEVFGAERSLLDVLDGFAAIGVDVVVAAPPVQDPTYLADLVDRCSELHCFPIPARHLSRRPDEAVVERFRELIDAARIDAVHANTIVMQEPLVAARRAGIPAVVNAREIPEGDPDLCRWLGGDPDEIVAAVLDDADYVITNSRCTARHFPLMGRTAVVPNAIDCARFPPRDATSSPTPVRVALIGSLTARKGLLEFLDVARLLLHRVEASFVLVGPPTALSHEVHLAGRIPPDVVAPGHVATPEEAMALADVVVSLSRCTESSSRVVMEAMGAGLPVVAYASGGIVELVVDGETGLLVPPGDVVRAARAIERLCHDPALRARLGGAGRQRAAARFGLAVLAEALGNAYNAILPPATAVAQRAADVAIPLATENRTGFDEAFFVGSRARFAHCTGVRWVRPGRLLAASLLGRRLDLIDVDRDTGSGAVVASFRTTDGVDEVSVDLFEVLGDRVITADCERSSVSCYRLSGDRLRHERTVGLRGAAAGYCHGVAFVPGQPDLVAVATTTGTPCMAFVDLRTGATVRTFTFGGWTPKSVAFLDDRRLVVPVMRRPVDHDPFTPHDTRLLLVELQDPAVDGDGGRRLLDDLLLPGTSADGCAVRGADVLVAAQTHDSILRFNVEGDRLVRRADLEGFSFPHDVAVSPEGEWLAVANYGDNTVSLRRWC